MATLLGELDYESVPAEQLAALTEAVCAGYEASRESLDRELLALYRAHKHFAKAERAARAIRMGGIERTAACLVQAGALLSGRGRAGSLA